MQYKIAQLMIQEVVDGKEADDVVKTFVEGENEVEEEVVEEKTETPGERANQLIDKWIEKKSD